MRFVEFKEFKEFGSELTYLVNPERVVSVEAMVASPSTRIRLDGGFSYVVDGSPADTARVLSLTPIKTEKGKIA